MKLIDLLSVIPDECEICLTRPDVWDKRDVGNKDEAIARFAYRNRLVKEQVENFDVYRAYPCSLVHAPCGEVRLFEDEVPPFYVKPEIIIEIE